MNKIVSMIHVLREEHIKNHVTEPNYIFLSPSAFLDVLDEMVTTIYERAPNKRPELNKNYARIAGYVSQGRLDKAVDAINELYAGSRFLGMAFVPTILPNNEKFVHVAFVERSGEKEVNVPRGTWLREDELPSINLPVNEEACVVTRR